MNNLDSTDINVLKSIKMDELKKELKFRHLPEKGNKDELIDFLLADNERVIADNLQEALIASRVKQNENSKRIADLQQENEALKNLQIGAVCSEPRLDRVELVRLFNDGDLVVDW
jgi:hypothetical protein